MDEFQITHTLRVVNSRGTTDYPVQYSDFHEEGLSATLDSREEWEACVPSYFTLRADGVLLGNGSPIACEWELVAK